MVGTHLNEKGGKDRESELLHVLSTVKLHAEVTGRGERKMGRGMGQEAAGWERNWDA